MKNNAMQREIIQTYKNKFVQEKGAGSIRKGESECIVFCKKVTPNIFDIKDGFAVVAGAEDLYNDGVCMISDFTKVVFVFDQGKDQGQGQGEGSGE
jgi:hypothetical protein